MQHNKVTPEWVVLAAITCYYRSLISRLSHIDLIVLTSLTSLTTLDVIIAKMRAVERFLSCFVIASHSSGVSRISNRICGSHISHRSLPGCCKEFFFYSSSPQYPHLSEMFEFLTFDK